MKKAIVIVSFLFLLVAPNVVSAQTTTQTLGWDYLATTVASTTLYATTLKIDTGTATPITPTCLQNGVDTHCSNPITLTAGNHTLTVMAILNGNSASGTVNYVPGAVPTGPSNIKVTITVTIP